MILKVFVCLEIPRPRSLMYLAICLFGMLCLAANALAAIPLITDDTGTQGKDKFQFELLGEYGRDEGERVTVSSSNFVATLTYGVIDPVDIILSIPYQYSPAKDSESVVKGNGISDSAIEAKWRFYEKDRVSFALKPGFTLPVGDEQKGLGAGRVTYYLYFITSKEISPWAIHANLAYFRNENTVDQRKNIWHASFASTVEVVENLKLAGDIGVRSNPDKSSKTPPAYVLGGLIYSLNNDLDVGLGVKGGLSRPEADIAVRGGITWRF